MNLNINKVSASSDDVDQALAKLQKRLSPRGDIVSPLGRKLTEAAFGTALSPQQSVLRICQDVLEKGLEKVLHYTNVFDGVELDAERVRVSREEIEMAHASADTEFLASVRRIRENILQFQSAVLPVDVEVNRAPNIRLQQVYLPLQRVGVCVPGGAAAYPSTVLMTVVPAQAAGVKEIAVVAPPTEFGAQNKDVLATCHELGIDEIYRVGGAQAVAALAYGCDSIASVQKIVGPGNLFVALAKKHLYGEVDIDSIAGPSEVVVLADSTSNPAYIAADLLAQAEHSPGAAVMVTWDENLLDRVESELVLQLGRLSRNDLTVDCLNEFGLLVAARSREHAVDLTNKIAPEHLHLQVDDARELLTGIRNAGAVFLGHQTPVALGDYVAGPSHVLPTGTTATWAHGLNAADFMRSMSVIEYDQDSLEKDAQDVQRLADKEGLTAHRASVDIRIR
ncbi:MAG: histidinol dehydrogenase [Planctomycetota bacterium]|nr:histidinol dehydrogenase [Planctomycetota bacterium]